jgi:quercetin dioxygenase-like cupin family protein
LWLFGVSLTVSHYFPNLAANPPVYVNNESIPYFDYGPGIQLKLLHADPYTGVWAIIFKAEKGAELGIHRHHGSVYGYTIKGEWAYKEHNSEWISKPGDFVFEAPTSIHTLYVPHVFYK